MRNAKYLIAFCAMAMLSIGVANAQIVATPIEWSKYNTAPQSEPLSEQALKIYRTALKYTMNDWYNNVKKFADQSGEFLDFGATTEAAIRPVAHEAFSLALALRLNVYDEQTTGVTKQDATKIALQLIRSLAGRHKATSGEKVGWGNHWQSALWSAQAVEAAWLMWDDLSETDRQNVHKMAVYEADRLLGQKIPYYKDLYGKVIYKGDSKAEENAWNSNILVAASVIFPQHPNSNKWHKKALEFQLSAYATPSDRLLTCKINGIRPSEFLQGSNLEQDGTVVNHGIIHADYMVAIMHNTINTSLYSLAGLSAPRVSVFNGQRVYEALTNLRFDNKTMYVRNEKGQVTPQMYFPQGNDWGTGRQANYWLMDVMAHCFGWDRNVEPKAIEWANARCQKMAEMQNRNANGCYYKEGVENKFDTREEFFTAQIALGYLILWTENNRMTKLTNKAENKKLTRK